MRWIWGLSKDFEVLISLNDGGAKHRENFEYLLLMAVVRDNRKQSKLSIYIKGNKIRNLPLIVQRLDKILF